MGLNENLDSYFFFSLSKQLVKAEQFTNLDTDLGMLRGWILRAKIYLLASYPPDGASVEA